jgi:hypothetical protein
MKRLAVLCWVLGMGGCASTPPAPPGTVLADPGLAQAVEPGVTTKAMLLARLGATSSIRLDSGYEVWRYLTPAAGGNFGEFVIVLDQHGIVAKTRRAPAIYHWQQEKR